jgi:precorrin-3B C17-methyltransferase
VKGKIFVVGIGPGKKELMTLKSLEAIKESSVIVGYKTYIKLIEEFIKNKIVIDSGMRKEVERCNICLEQAEKGNTVSLISSGDAGVYGMAGLMLEIANDKKSDIKIEVIPGITSALSSASVLGAPLMHDFAVISLSDLMTDWEIIKLRIDYAAKADFVLSIYNPKSNERKTNIVEAREIILKYRKPSTPVGIVKNCGRENEEVIITNVDEMLNYEIDMSSTLIIGNSKTYIADGKIITPRGYVL